MRFGIIKRMVKKFLGEVESIGGVTHNRVISPKGIYSKPVNENALIINLAKGTNQDVVIAIQKDVELEDGDVMVTDNNSYIHFKFNSGEIEIKATKVTIKGNVETFGTLKNNGVNVGSTHTHTGDSGGTTSTPN